jgi:cytochrome c-type biogenesis protein CcmF
VDPIDRWRRGLTLPRAVLGMTVAHLGLALAAFALTSVQSFTIERDVALAPGQTAKVGDYEVRFEGVRPVEGPNYDAVGGTLVVTRHGAPVAVMTPQKRRYWVQHTVKSETAIRWHRGNNVLLALGEDLGSGRWSIRVQIRPLVSLVWIAAFIMALGGALAASDRRYRTARAVATAPEATAVGQAG